MPCSVLYHSDDIRCSCIRCVLFYLSTYAFCIRMYNRSHRILSVTCHKTYISKINHIRKALPEEEQFKHENFAPAIISKEKWEQVQFLLSSKRNNVRASSGNPCHRYTGLFLCKTHSAKSVLPLCSHISTCQ